MCFAAHHTDTMKKAMLEHFHLCETSPPPRRDWHAVGAPALPLESQDARPTANPRRRATIKVAVFAKMFSECRSSLTHNRQNMNTVLQ